MSKPFRISPVYDRLLRGNPALSIGLYQLHIATADQLTRLHYSPNSLKWVKARLKVLVDHDYLQADCIPTKFFRSPYYYTLGQRGMQYLGAAGLDVSDAFRASKEVNKHALFIEHTLELNDVLIAAALINRTFPRCHLDSFIHERVLKRRPFKTKHFTIIPDAFLDFRLSLPDGRQRRMPLLLEHDRGSEEQHYFKRRIRAYIVLLKAEAYKGLFSAKAITIAFTTFVGTRRLEHMREWTRQELALTNEPASVCNTFLFANFNRPLESRHLLLEPQWYTPTSDQAIPLLTEV